MKCAEQDLLLYAVTDRHWRNGRSLRDVVEESLRGGVTMLQLREKSLAELARPGTHICSRCSHRSQVHEGTFRRSNATDHLRLYF